MTWWIALIALVVSATVGWPLVIGMLTLARNVGPEQVQHDRGARVIQPPPVPQPRVLRGGAIIGVLERLATTGLILAGSAGLIAVVVGVKALGRWTDLGDPVVNEKFIIGSLSSYLWAGLCGFVAIAAAG